MVTILVAEDDKNIRKLLTTILTYNGYHTLQTADGLEVLQRLNQESINLLVLDLMMPHLDGYETLTEIRKMNQELPVMIVTAKGQSVERRQGFILGTDDYLVKPIDEQEFVLWIKALLRRTKKRRKHTIKNSQNTY